MLNTYAYVFDKDTKLDGGGWFNGKFVGETKMVLLGASRDIKPHADEAESIIDLRTGEVVKAMRFSTRNTFNGVMFFLAKDGIHLDGLLPGMPADLTECYRPLTLEQMNNIGNKLARMFCNLNDELNQLIGRVQGPTGHHGYHFESTRQACLTMQELERDISELKARIAAIKESPTRGGTILNNDTVNIMKIASDFNIEVPQ